MMVELKAHCGGKIWIDYEKVVAIQNQGMSGCDVYTDNHKFHIGEPFEVIIKKFDLELDES